MARRHGRWTTWCRPCTARQAIAKQSAERGGTGVSKSQVSRLCGEIDERVDAFVTRPIKGEWPYLWIDATSLKLRQGGRVVSVAVTHLNSSEEPALSLIKFHLFRVINRGSVAQIG